MIHTNWKCHTESIAMFEVSCHLEYNVVTLVAPEERDVVYIYAVPTSTKK